MKFMQQIIVGKTTDLAWPKPAYFWDRGFDIRHHAAE